jgi:hypothetical protein
VTRGVAFPVVLLLAAVVAAQPQDHHLSPVSGVPHGIPRLCAAPTTRSIRDGGWSNPSIWSGGRVPSASDSVLITVGTNVTYDAVSDGAIDCIDIEGALRFRTDANTRLTVVTLTVLATGRLEIGTPEVPISGPLGGDHADALDATAIPSSSAAASLASGPSAHRAAQSPTLCGRCRAAHRSSTAHGERLSDMRATS